MSRSVQIWLRVSAAHSNGSPLGVLNHGAVVLPLPAGEPWKPKSGEARRANGSPGVATTAAVMLHELPQEIGDYGILLHAWLERRRALERPVGTGRQHHRTRAGLPSDHSSTVGGWPTHDDVNTGQTREPCVRSVRAELIRVRASVSPFSKYIRHNTAVYYGASGYCGAIRGFRPVVRCTAWRQPDRRRDIRRARGSGAGTRGVGPSAPLRVAGPRCPGHGHFRRTAVASAIHTSPRSAGSDRRCRIRGGCASYATTDQRLARRICDVAYPRIRRCGGVRGSPIRRGSGRRAHRDGTALARHREPGPPRRNHAHRRAIRASRGPRDHSSPTDSATSSHRRRRLRSCKRPCRTRGARRARAPCIGRSGNAATRVCGPPS
jgi:hypothetical protein